MDENIAIYLDMEVVRQQLKEEYRFPITGDSTHVQNRVITNIDDSGERMFSDEFWIPNENILQSMDSTRRKEVETNILLYKKMLYKAKASYLSNSNTNRYEDSLYGFKSDKLAFLDLMSIPSYMHIHTDGITSVFVVDFRSHAYEILRYLMRPYISPTDFDSAFEKVLKWDFPEYSLEYSKKYISKSWIDSYEILTPYSLSDVFEPDSKIGNAIFDFCAEYGDINKVYNTNIYDIRKKLYELGITSKYDVIILTVLNVVVKYLTDGMFEILSRRPSLKCISLTDGRVVGQRKDIPLEEEVIDKSSIPAIRIDEWHSTDALCIPIIQEFTNGYGNDLLFPQSKLVSTLINSDV